MPINKEHIFDSDIYFITYTNYTFIPLFHIINGYEIVYNWFPAVKDGGHSVLGCLIMPNHIHGLIGYKKSARSINTLVSNGNRFMAYDVVNKLKQTGNNALLKTLQEGVNQSERKRGKLHEVFKDSFDISLVVESTRFFCYALAYTPLRHGGQSIHNCYATVDVV